MLTLHRLSPGYRVLYTAVLLFMTAGTVFHAVHQHVRSGILPGQVAAWYLGNADDPSAAVMLFPRSFEEVVGDVWTALTTYTLALLVFGGILFRSDASAWLRAGLVGLFALGGLAAAAAPLLVRYVSARFAILETAALVGLPLVAIAMTALAVWEMWARRGAGPRFDPGRRV